MQTDINKMDDYKRVLNFVRQMVPQLGNAKPVVNRMNSDVNSFNSINGGSSPGQLVDEASQPMLGEIQFISGTIKAED
jgi:hypothetical protein